MSNESDLQKRTSTVPLKSGKIIFSMIGLSYCWLFSSIFCGRGPQFFLYGIECSKVFTVFLICNLAFVLVLVPAFCATSLTTEKENNTFIMLYTTMLKPLNILNGKLMASLTMISIIIICTMPISALVFNEWRYKSSCSQVKAYIIIFVAFVYLRHYVFSLLSSM